MWKQQKIMSAYITVTVMTDSIERFLNMCRHKNIGFWKISETEQGFTANITREDFFQLKDICRKTKTTVQISKRHGIRFLLFRYRRHSSFFIGIAAACIILYSCSLYVWDISFTGNYRYTHSSLCKYLAGQGVYSGMQIRSVDCDSIETALRNDYPDITWVSAEISGTRLIVHIKENDGIKEDIQTDSTPRDIVATCSGVVTSMITRAGTPKVKPGDEVEKGQILVSGIVDVYNDAKEVVNQRPVSADADIFVRVDIPYEEHLPYLYEYKEYTGRKKTRWLFGIADREIEAGVSWSSLKQADIVTDSRVLKLTDSFYLPLRTGRKQYLEYDIKESRYTQEEAEDVLNQKLKIYLLDLIENKVQILHNGVTINDSGTDYVMAGTITADMPAVGYAAVTMPEIEGNEETKAVQ